MSKDVALIYTHGDHVRPAFMRSVIEHAVPDDRVGIVRGFGPSGLIASIRNKACGWFLGNPQYEWLWFLDADIQIEPDTLSRMFEVANLDELSLVTGHYWGLGDDDGPVSVWVQFDKAGERKRLRQLPDAFPVELAGTGAGCLLMHRNVLEIVGSQNRDDPYRWFGHDIEGDVRLGEDYTFCNRVIQAGMKVWGADAPVKHHKLVAI